MQQLSIFVSVSNTRNGLEIHPAVASQPACGAHRQTGRIGDPGPGNGRCTNRASVHGQ